jgi:hypothetical protein
MKQAARAEKLREERGFYQFADDRAAMPLAGALKAAQA